MFFMLILSFTVLFSFHSLEDPTFQFLANVSLASFSSNCENTGRQRLPFQQALMRPYMN
jgi:hypothetical protein